MTYLARLRFRWNEPRFEGRRIVIELASTSAALAAVLWGLLRLLSTI